jgi:uncharacterized protein YjbK
MRIAATFLMLAAVGALTACSVVPQQAFRFDPTQLAVKTTLSVPEAAGLTERLAQLQLQRAEIRAQIATERDPWVRQAHYARLHQVGVELSPLQRRLASVQTAL